MVHLYTEEPKYSTFLVAYATDVTEVKASIPGIPISFSVVLSFIAKQLSYQTATRFEWLKTLIREPFVTLSFQREEALTLGT